MTTLSASRRTRPPRSPFRRGRALQEPVACVLGDMDLVRPLALARIRSAVVAPPGDPAQYSRWSSPAVDWVDPWEQPAELVRRLLDFAVRQPEPPVLFYQHDCDLLLVSRERDRLAAGFRFVVAARELVEDLVDKARFRELARRLDLPVPPSARFTVAGLDADGGGLRFPLVLKPTTRRGFERWVPLAGGGKAIEVASREALRELAPRLAKTGIELLAQELVPGPEKRVESYHAYVNAAGEVMAEFTGRKIRTRPAAFGRSTALELTDTRDVADLGRELVRRIGLVGVAKLDFKRADDGRLFLLEVNPRFNTWHHLAATAGVNLPALVYSDLTAREPPRAGPARAGARWCFHVHDALAAREQGIPLRRWLSWAARCDAISTCALDDPLPFARGEVERRLRRAARRIVAHA